MSIKVEHKLHDMRMLGADCGSAKRMVIRIMIIKTGGMENEYIRGQWFEKGLHDEIWRQ